METAARIAGIPGSIDRIGSYLVMEEQKSKDPLHGVTLEMMLVRLVEHYGWVAMGKTIRIRCFTNDPSISSSLKFLRKTPWARKKVEDWYLRYSKETRRGMKGDTK